MTLYAICALIGGTKIISGSMSMKWDESRADIIVDVTLGFVEESWCSFYCLKCAVSDRPKLSSILLNLLWLLCVIQWASSSRYSLQWYASIWVFLSKHNNFGDGKEQMWMVREYTDFHPASNIHTKQYSHLLYYLTPITMSTTAMSRLSAWVIQMSWRSSREIGHWLEKSWVGGGRCGW